MYEKTLIESLADMVLTLQDLRYLSESPDTRSRELSLAITNFEQAMMWLETALKAQSLKTAGNK
jgi:hypothetical protein